MVKGSSCDGASVFPSFQITFIHFSITSTLDTIPSLTISGLCSPDEERKTGQRINVLGFPPLHTISNELFLDNPKAPAASLQE